MALTVSVDEIVHGSRNPLLAVRPHWKRIRLREIASALNGFAFKSTQFTKGEGMPLIRIRDVGGDSTDTNFVGEFDERYIVEPGDLLVGMDGDFNCARWRGPRGLLNQRVCKVSLYSKEFDPRFLDFALPGYLKAINEATSSVTVKHLSSRTVEDIPLPFPPLHEQENIVAEIEKQFSRLDEAVANLKRVKVNLKRYKATVLKAAVKGCLVPTEAELAGCEGRGYESGSQLLSRVLEERRRAWSGKGTYQDPERPEVRGLPPLPEGWAWARLDAVAALKGGTTVDKKRRDPTARSVPYLRVANVQRGYLDLKEVKEIEAPQADIEELRLRPGDILFNEGGDRDKLGRGWIWEGQLAECIHQNHVFRARTFLADVSGKLISWWGNTFGKDYFLREGKQTTNLASINMTKLSAFPVPIPPVAEQHRVVAEVDRHLTIVREVEAEVDANLARALGLRQSVLGRAFAPTGALDALA
jgi:type I restriction enzyme, S subunit